MKSNKKAVPVRQHENGQVSGDELTSITTNYTQNQDVLQQEIDDKFQPKKAASSELAVCYNFLGLQSRAARVRDCGSFLEFKVPHSDDRARLHQANFCRDRLCPMCNWRRSLKIFSQVSQVMNVLESQGFQFLFLTLTVRNCSAADLPKTVDALLSGWRFLYNKSRRFKGAVCGTFRSLEVTRNKKTGTYHPHLHVVLAVQPEYFHRGYISQPEWAAMWRAACSLDYQPVVDVRRIKPNSKGLAGAVAEVSKYAVKAVDFLDPSDVDGSAQTVGDFLAALTRKRLCDFTGVFRQIRQQLALDDPENGDLVHVDGEDLRQDVAFLIVRYRWVCGVYLKEVLQP